MNTPKIYEGIFWIKQDERGRFIPITVKSECDEFGNVLDARMNFSSKFEENFNHKEEWKIFEAMPGGEYRGLPYNYYPRGRVEIKNKKATVYLNPVICNEYIKQLILEEFGLIRNDVDVTFVTDSSLDCKYTAKVEIHASRHCSKKGNFMIDNDKKYTFEEVLAMLPEETEESRILDKFMQLLKNSLEFIRTTDEFKTVDMQRYLKCGYSYAWRVIDTLLLLGLIEEDVEEYIPGGKYKVKYAL